MASSKPFTQTLNKCINFVQRNFAQNCLLCGASSGSHLICQSCIEALPRLHATHACPICAAPDTLGVCGQCLQHPPYFQRTSAALRYTFPIDQLIQSYKYHEQLALARLFSECLRQTASSQPRPDKLLPMPLHPQRLRERGFNQALEIAKILGKAMELPIDAQSAQRVLNTAAQATLDWEARKKNMRGAFTCNDNVMGQHIAIIDDVMTSGATLNELSKTLKQAGATEISVWVVARATPHP